jgi:hypothetical protein
MYGKRPSLEQAQQAEVPALPDRGYPEQSELYEIVARALQRDRNLRWESAREMVHGLEDYARRTRLTASPLRFGEWLVEHFGSQILEWRKARERAARALELGPVLELKTVHTPEAPEVKSAPVREQNEHLPLPSPRSESGSGPAVTPPDRVASGTRPVPRPAPALEPNATLWLLVLVLVLAAAAGAYLLR